jgi:outer membrane protein
MHALRRGILAAALVATGPALSQGENATPAAAPAPQAPADAPVAPHKLSVDDCVRIALADSGLVVEAKGKVTEWEGRLAEVQSTFYPKLMGLGYVAPLYSVTGSPLAPDVTRDYSAWGPYFHLQATLAQPIYTFGRYTAGKTAAEERLAVEKARYEQARNVLALEVRKYYYLHLYALSFKPALESAKRILDEADAKSKEMYAEGSGKVTNVDLMKLKYGITELEKYRVQADIGSELALAALKHTMGLPMNAAIVADQESLPSAPSDALPTLATFIQKAAENRPEVKQLKHGEKAAISFEEAERLAMMPVAFVAGQLDLNYTPMWPDSPNPFHYDRYNDITPGAAIGLQFDIDIAKSLARAKSAHGTVEQVEGLKKFASTGIPMEVRKAYDDAVQAEKLLKLSDEGSVAGRKWMIFAGSAYVAGTGEAKDLLEGMVAYLTAKKSYYDALQSLHVARATLQYAVGETGVEGK